MIRLCPECLKKYDTPAGKLSLEDTKQKKQNLYCMHTFHEIKSLNPK